MRLLIFAKRFSSEPSGKWLTDELIDEFVRRGWDVQVVLLDLEGRWEYGRYDINEKIKLSAYPINAARSGNRVFKYIRYYFNWMHACRNIRKNRYGDIDLLINFSIASVFYGIKKAIEKNNKIRKSLVIIWDFFPVHQYEIGKIRSALLEKILYYFESREISSYQYAAMMSERNIQYFRRYHPGFKGEVFKLPVWGGLEDGKDRHANLDQMVNTEKFNIVFGGQFSRGRGIVELLDCIGEFDNKLQNVNFILIGDGELRGYIENRIKSDGMERVQLLARVDRSKYLSLLRSCQAGLIITVPGVSVPTFPSKVIDYLKAGIPVIAAVESTTDFGQYISEKARCGLASEVGDNQALFENIMALRESPERCKTLGENGYKYFLEYFSVRRVVDRLLKNLALEAEMN